MCFGKSSDKSSKQMVQMQKDEAAAARQKEADRQARIQSGLDRIKAAFEGSSVMGKRSKTYTASAPAAGTASGAAVSGLPSGYTYKLKTTPGSAASAASGSSGGQNYVDHTMSSSSAARSSMSGGRSSMSGYGSGSPQSGGSGTGVQDSRLASGGTQGTSKWVVVGPDGKEYEIGTSVTGDEEYDTGQRTGGIGDEFYNKYKQGIVDYYMPQVAEKYGDAKDELTFRLARAGLLRSSMANTETADLAKQNTLNEGKVRSDADKAAADLKARVASEKAKAESQLYATENPDVAANQATAAIQNITSEKADTSPLGDIFSIAAIGGANALNAYRTQSYKKQIPGSQQSSRVVSS